jgi:hypothetical protein
MVAATSVMVCPPASSIWRATWSFAGVITVGRPPAAATSSRGGQAFEGALGDQVGEQQ